MRDEFGGDEAACRLRFHAQTAGSTLTAQQPLANVVRVAVQALAAVLGGTQSLHTNAFDEALALPTTDSARLALRTQQVLAFESGVTGTADPLGGSYYVEALTAELETRARELMAEVERRGGAVRAIAEGFIQHEIARSAYAEQRAIEAGDEVVVGVNRYQDGAPVEAPRAPDYSALAARQLERLAAARASRDAPRCAVSLQALRDAAAQPSAPLMELIVEAVRARATVGEITLALESAWGRHGTSLTTSSHTG
jgi:methylmalonyl-CoA mutase N-terminal domain/subunit